MALVLASVNRKHMREAAEYLGLDLDTDVIATRAALPAKTPVFLAAGERPHPELFDYGLHMAATLAPQSQRQYAYTTKRFVDFLDDAGVPITRVTESVLGRYRRDRVASGLAMTSWASEAMVIRRLIDYLVQTGRMPKRPWIEVGQRNVLSATVRPATNVRHLTARQWLSFRNIGLRGHLPDGSADPTFRCSDIERNVLGSEIAVGTGLRLAEFASLLTSEALAPEFTIGACAKRGIAREVYLVERMNQAVAQYLRGTRKALVHSRQGRYRRIRSELIVIPETDLRSGSVRLPDAKRRVPVSALDPATRRRLFVDRGDYLDPAALFLGQTGLMLGESAWTKVFRAASDRVARFPEAAQTARGVSAHDFRHTFAVRMMGHLMRAGVAAYQERVNRGENPQQSLGEALSLNPLITLQHRLGHASPSTTAVYLRYVEDAKAIIERVLVEWDDEVGQLASASDETA